MAQNSAGQVDSAILRKRARKQGTNYEDTILTPAAPSSATSPTVLGGY